MHKNKYMSFKNNFFPVFFHNSTNLLILYILYSYKPPMHNFSIDQLPKSETKKSIGRKNGSESDFNKLLIIALVNLNFC